MTNTQVYLAIPEYCINTYVQQYSPMYLHACRILVACIQLSCIFIGALKGFIDVGDINSHLVEFEQFLNEETRAPPPLANSMLVFMVRGLLSNLEFPYAQFPCTTLTGEQIFVPFWEAVSRLERCGFKVMGVTADGLSVNHHFFKLHGESTTDNPVHKTSNPYTSEERSLYFFSDLPHLIKTVRNCWASKKRNLWVCNI